MKYLKNRLIVLMLMLMIPNAWTLADNCYLSDNHHPIQIKASHVQGVPKGFTIQASINGHTIRRGTNLLSRVSRPEVSCLLCKLIYLQYSIHYWSY